MNKYSNKKKQVVLVWGGWTCQAGYTHWAYVAVYEHDQPVNTEMPGCEKIGTRIFEAPNRNEITDPKNGRYNTVPHAHPKPVCRQWITINGYQLVDEIKMRSD